MEKVNEISRRWHEKNIEKRRVEDIIGKLEDIATFGGYKITFEKSTRGTTDPAKVELEAKFPGDLSLAVEVMAEAISAYNTLLAELKKDLADIERMMKYSQVPSC